MKLFFASLAVVASPFLAGCTEKPQAPSGGGKAGAIAWRTDVDAALAEAKAAGKPAVIDFHADW